MIWLRGSHYKIFSCILRDLMVRQMQFKYVWYFQKGQIFVAHLRVVTGVDDFVFNSAMGCYILFFIQMFTKWGMSAGDRVLQPMLERFFLSSIRLLTFEARTSYGAAGNSHTKNILSAVCDLSQAGRFQKNFCLFSRDCWDFYEQAPFHPHAICSNMLEIHWTARKLCSLCKCRYYSCLPWLSGMLGIRRKKEQGERKLQDSAVRNELGAWRRNRTRNKEYNLRLHLCNIHKEQN